MGIVISILVIIIGVLLIVQFRDYLTSATVTNALMPYIMVGWYILTGLTVLACLQMVYSIWKLRAKNEA
ncbi:MAG TPA: hypothetical protein VNS08_07315 [Ureibacillus sp.]|nr:hypothetical protein [Ureibacillus sp.]